MTSTNHSTTTIAWNALLAAYREQHSAYTAAFDVVADDDQRAQDTLHARLKPFFDAVLAFPVETADQLVEKAVIIEADYWDIEKPFLALGRDARRIAGV